MPERPEKKIVVILGGGVAGMSAAHHLIRRNFSVRVIEHNMIPGGKARSYPAKGTDLPAEHGFRFFASFYYHIIDTMKEIPFGEAGQSVADQLVPVGELGFARYGKEVTSINNCPPREVPLVQTEADIVDRLALIARPFDLTTEEILAFSKHMMKVFGSCKQRRVNEFNHIPWAEFIEAHKY